MYGWVPTGGVFCLYWTNGVCALWWCLRSLCVTVHGVCFFVSCWCDNGYRQSFALDGCLVIFSLFVHTRVVLFCGLVAERQYNPPSSSTAGAWSPTPPPPCLPLAATPPTPADGAGVHVWVRVVVCGGHPVGQQPRARPGDIPARYERLCEVSACACGVWVVVGWTRVCGEEGGLAPALVCCCFVLVCVWACVCFPTLIPMPPCTLRGVSVCAFRGREGACGVVRVALGWLV